MISESICKNISSHRPFSASDGHRRPGADAAAAVPEQRIAEGRVSVAASPAPLVTAQGHGVRAPCKLGRVGQVRPGRPCIGACEYIRFQWKGREFIAGAPRSTCATRPRRARGLRRVRANSTRRPYVVVAARARAGLQKRHRRREGRGRWVFCLGLLIDVCVPPATVREASRRTYVVVWCNANNQLCIGNLALYIYTPAHTACSLSSAWCTVMRQPCPGWYIIHVVENVGVLCCCRSFVPHLKIDDSFKKSFQAPKCGRPGIWQKKYIYRSFTWINLFLQANTENRKFSYSFHPQINYKSFQFA